MSETRIIADVAEQIAAQARLMGPHERAGYVEHHCASSATLKAHVDALLRQAEQDAQYWEHTVDGNEWAPRSLVGAHIGCFKLNALLGRGGMGEVYRAHRVDGEFEQTVAIKVVRNHLLNDEVRQRLKAERQILADLAHPNIASLLDGGTAPDGSPYLVMEYIQGKPIDQYCEEQRLTLEQRIELFCKVCAAVQCAHQNLVVHRDLKPGNILVTPEGEPKLLDFGIAKLLERQVSNDYADLTQYGFRVLTPAHAAPEQVRGEAITTACDVYVLGVVLYELLCGRRPYTLPLNCRLSDIEKLVCRTTAPVMSQMLARTRQLFEHAAQQVAEDRNTTVPKLIRTLSGDLDNIVAMAMRKNPQRRYASATQLADDLQNWLQGQPVQAAPVDVWYRLRRLVRRRPLASMVAASLVLVAGCIALLAWWYTHNMSAQRSQLAAQQRHAEQTSAFMLDLFAAADPTRRYGNEVSARALLDIGAQRLNDNPQWSTGTRTSLLADLGKAYGQLGLYAESATALHQALTSREQQSGVVDAGVADELPALALTHLAQGQLDEAERTLNRSDAWLAQQLIGSTVLRAGVQHARGRLALARQRPEEAQTQWHLALATLGTANVWLKAQLAGDLAELWVAQQRYAEAETGYRNAVSAGIKALGEQHPQVAMLRIQLADVLAQRGDATDADTLFKVALATQRRVLGVAHPATLESLERYAEFSRLQGRLLQARALITEALATRRQYHGEHDIHVAHDRVRLGMVNYDAGDAEDARQQALAAMKIYQPDGEVVAAATPQALVAALTGLGRAALKLNQLDQADAALTRAARLANQQLVTPADAVLRAQSQAALGLLRWRQGRVAIARPLLEQALPLVIEHESRSGVLAMEVAQQLAVR